MRTSDSRERGSWSWSSIAVFVFFAAAAIGAVLLSKLGPFPTQVTGTSAPESIRSIAILPLQNSSRNPDHDDAAEMTDKLTSTLGQISAWKVIDSKSAAQYRSTTKSKMQIARELQVDGLMEGSVQRINNRIQLTLQLTDGSGDHEIWAMTYDRDPADLQTLADEIALDLAQQLQLKSPSHGPE